MCEARTARPLRMTGAPRRLARNNNPSGGVNRGAKVRKKSRTARRAEIPAPRTSMERRAPRARRPGNPRRRGANERGVPAAPSLGRGALAQRPPRAHAWMNLKDACARPKAGEDDDAGGADRWEPKYAQVVQPKTERAGGLTCLEHAPRDPAQHLCDLQAHHIFRREEDRRKPEDGDEAASWRADRRRSPPSRCMSRSAGFTPPLSVLLNHPSQKISPIEEELAFLASIRARKGHGLQINQNNTFFLLWLYEKLQTN
ncbi:hypothetical protein FB451DRAFT_1164222 [Mycena latifolia]|nr:hypothetical protein FB451DRAFT_1164222 [Mycena latifolia]